MEKKTQTDRVLERLRKSPLTQMEALTELGVMRLGARILELREAGHKIETETVEVATRVTGETARVARYRLTECDAGHDYRNTGEAWGQQTCTRCGLITAPTFQLEQQEAAP